MSLVQFADDLYPESSIGYFEQHDGRWTAWLRDGGTLRPPSDPLPPCIVSVIPNTSIVRLLLVALFSDGEHMVEERPILAWRVSAPAAEASHGECFNYSDAQPIFPGSAFLVGSNQAWCFVDPQTGQCWDDDFSAPTREAAVECLLERLRPKRTQATTEPAP
jgi:hypothetical protein